MSFLQRYWYKIRSSFWFVPGLIVAGMTLLAYGAVELDSRVGNDALRHWPRLFGAEAQGSRSLLAAVATSMITVAGTVFSITLVALSLASSQYSSRVLRNFMTDRTNQVVLGVFVGIFVYCMVVLRTVRAGDTEAFVPSIAVLLAVVLGFVGVGFLVFFIHHISVAIQASQIVAAVGRETRRTIDHLFPCVPPDSHPESEPRVPQPGSGRWQVITATRNGYLQQVDTGRLLEFASKRDEFVRLEHGIGEFIVAGLPLIAICSEKPIDSDSVDWLRSCCGIGRQRTLEQDAGFGIRQLVDVALKGLSPGVNDTTTAVMCIDQLTAVLGQVSGRRLRYLHCTDNGVVRVQIPHPRFDRLLRTAFDQIRQNARGNVAVLERLLWSSAVLTTLLARRDRLQVLRDQVVLIGEAGNRDIADPTDRQLFVVRTGATLAGIDQRLVAIDGAGHGGDPQPTSS